MKDRAVQYPGRYEMVPVAGQPTQVDLVPVPGIVTEAGTDLNKVNLLSDATASKVNTNLGVITPTTVNEALNALANKPVKIATGTYTGTGTYGASNPTSLTFDFAPKLLMLFNYRGNIAEQSYSNSVMYAIGLCTMLTTSYVAGALFGVNVPGARVIYAKKSADGKTIYWYTYTSVNEGLYQYNDAGVTYGYLALN